MDIKKFRMLDLSILSSVFRIQIGNTLILLKMVLAFYRNIQAKLI
jgi:hypothetical protein